VGERQISHERAPTLKRRVGKVLRGIEVIEISVGVLLLTTILFMVMAQVIVRFTPFGGWVWTGELARFCLVWLTFAVAGYLMGRREHIAIDIIDQVLPRRGRRLVDIVSHLVVGITAIAFLYQGVGLMEAQSGVRSSAAEIPMSLLYAIPTIGFALTALRAFVAPFVGKEST
jgi:TRAP-type C4-dicarboxylate transport system permease small subunit